MYIYKRKLVARLMKERMLVGSSLKGKKCKKKIKFSKVPFSIKVIFIVRGYYYTRSYQNENL